MSTTDYGSNGTGKPAKAKAKSLGDRLDPAMLPAEARDLIARVEHEAARGLRLAAKQLDRAAFQLDCASRRLSPRNNGPRSSPVAERPRPSGPDTDDAMDDELLSPHLA